MIFNTVQKHAEKLIEAGKAGTPCLVLQRIWIDFESMDASWETAQANNKATKLNVPLLLFGVQKDCEVMRFGKNPANASKNTFQKNGITFPEKWFPWAEHAEFTLPYDSWKLLLQQVTKAPPEEIIALFSNGGPLQTFDLNSSSLENQAKAAVCLPVTCSKPNGLVHAILGCNALSLKPTGQSLISAESLRFCLLMWLFDSANKQKVRIVPETEPNRDFSVNYVIRGGGNLLGNFVKENLVAEVSDNFIIGVKYATGNFPSEFERFVGLTGESAIDTIKLGAVAYTAPETGKSPTNPVLNAKGDNCLSEEVRFGFQRDQVFPAVDGFTALVDGTRFSLGGVLSYYVFPEKTDSLPDYVVILRDFLSQLRAFKDEYFNELKKSAASEAARARRDQKLKDLLEHRRKIWGSVWNKWPVGEWIFAIEENVGSSNQQQNTWTSVYRGLPLVRTFLFLHLADDPSTFGQLVKTLKSTAHNLNEGWVSKELKLIIEAIFSLRTIDCIQQWHRWRGYLVRSNQSEDPINANLWENALHVLLRIKAIDDSDSDEQMTGLEIILSMHSRIEDIVMQNKEEIKVYLTGIFPDASWEEGDPQKVKDRKQNEANFIEGKAEDYARFVDVDSTGWQHLIDGLICGWALKSACLILRDDYKSVIGGRTLARQNPSEARILMVDLVEKASRSGKKPWNVDTPLELLFKWSLKNAYSPDTILFMDALSLGFMRYDHKTAKTHDK